MGLQDFIVSQNSYLKKEKELSQSASKKMDSDKWWFLN